MYITIKTQTIILIKQHNPNEITIIWIKTENIVVVVRIIIRMRGRRIRRRKWAAAEQRKSNDH